MITPSSGTTDGSRKTFVETSLPAATLLSLTAPYLYR